MLIALKRRAPLITRGAKARDVLQGQSTCDAMGLERERIGYGACCNPKGRAMCVFTWFSTNIGCDSTGGDDTPSLWLLMPSETVELTEKFLKPYAALSRVALEDGSDKFAGFGVCDSNGLAKARELWGEIPETIGDLIESDKYVLLRVGEDRLECWVAKDYWGESYDVLKESVDIGDENEWIWRDIKAGIATIFPSSSGEFLPQMLNLEAFEGISYNKGCYTGQEVIARAHTLGQIKRSMIRAEGFLKVEPKAGDVLYNAENKACGKVLLVASMDSAAASSDSSSNSNDKDYALLAVTKIEPNDELLFIDDKKSNGELRVIQRYDA